MAERYKRTPNAQCVMCGKRIYKRPSELEKNKRGIFCGMACYGMSCRKEKPCIVCGTPILAGANKKTCCRSCANKHRTGIQYKINRPKDKVKSQQALKIRLLQNRGRACERCACDRYEILEVHHRDKNRNNNDIHNLELICPNCHAEEHYSGNSWLKKYR